MNSSENAVRSMEDELALLRYENARLEADKAELVAACRSARDLIWPAPGCSTGNDVRESVVGVIDAAVWNAGRQERESR